MSLTWPQGDWRADSACLGTDPDLFFPISATGRSAKQVAAAKAICARCPVRSACFEFALTQRDIQGIWGGSTDEERKKMRRARVRARARAA
jgi:WhiB family redox-sensing transcriptional regulator